MGARTLVAGRVKLLGAGQCVNVNGEVAALMRPLLGSVPAFARRRWKSRYKIALTEVGKNHLQRVNCRLVGARLASRLRQQRAASSTAINSSTGGDADREGAQRRQEGVGWGAILRPVEHEEDVERELALQDAQVPGVRPYQEPGGVADAA